MRKTQNSSYFLVFLDEVFQNLKIEPKVQLLEGKNFHNKTTTTEDDFRLDTLNINPENARKPRFLRSRCVQMVKDVNSSQPDIH